KDNLACLSLLKAKSLQLKISNTAPEWGKGIEATALNRVFKDSFNIKIANALSSSNLFYLEKLIDSKGQHLLLWPEIKFKTGTGARGRKLLWFKLLEKLVIEDVNTRSVKSKWMIQNSNKLLLALMLPKISNDKRKREWLMSNENEVFKLRDKKVKTVQVEHWRPINNLMQGEVVMEKCKGCGLNSSLVEGTCISRSKINNDWRVIPKSLIKRAEGNPQMSLNFNLVSERKKSVNSMQLANKQEFSCLNIIESVEVELIMQSELSANLKDSLLEAFNRNKNWQQSKICYYMDGSLQSENKKDINLAAMGAVVVQVNTEKDLVLKEISLLEVLIKTDSAVAIVNIDSIKNFTMSRHWIKQKNANLLGLIKKALIMKEIKIVLVKVKGYSNNR
ncbi:13490_t:CDS:2, partial [Gigaspora rosea]